jgi:hypothetical protein
MKLKVLALPISLALVIGLFFVGSPNAGYSTTSTSCTVSLSGSQEVPPVDTEGNGTGTVDFDPSTNELSWSIEFSGLSGPATAAHFHGPAAAGTNAGVQVNIGEVSGLESPMEGSAELTAEQAEWLMDGELYVNIHTAENPDGEVRGQVECEPATDNGTFPVETVTIGDEEFQVQYNITGGTLDGISADPDIQTLTVDITSTSDGSLTLWLPTDAIDSEDEFDVFVDGEFGNFVVDELEPVEGARVLQIEFESGTEQIEILGTSMMGGEQPEQETVSVEIEGQTYDIPFEISGGSIEGVEADVESMSLLFTILSNSSGTLTLWLPTELIDADGEFSVFVDGNETAATELDPTADARVLEVEFDEGAQEIEVMGTSIVPEFGPLALLATVAATGAIVMAYRFRKFGGSG